MALAWLYLAVAIGSEVVATLELRELSNGIRPLPLTVVIVGYTVSFLMLIPALRHISVGVSYAVWSAVGTAGGGHLRCHPLRREDQHARHRRPGAHRRWCRRAHGVWFGSARMTDVSGLVLAAGAGRRMGQPKADADRRRRAPRRPGRPGIASGRMRRGRDCRSRRARDPDAQVVVNPEPERGMGSSLRLALAAATGHARGDPARRYAGHRRRRGTGGACSRLLRSWSLPYRGRRGHPVVVDRSWWAEVAERAEGDRGARPFLAAHPELVREVECAGDPSDLDTASGIWRRGGTSTPASRLAPTGLS